MGNVSMQVPSAVSPLLTDILFAAKWLSASLGQLGRMNDAYDVLQKLIKMSPASIDFYVRDRPPWFRPEDHDHVVRGLRKAGWEGSDRCGFTAPKQPPDCGAAIFP
jgi:hypothetical protein